MQMEKAMSGRMSNDQFDLDKGIAALAILVDATGESMYSLLKMMYLADKLHLQRFGRFIAGDRYAAMKQGPVPSNAYGIFQHLGGKSERPEFAVAGRYFEYQPQDGHKVILREMPDTEELSQGEIDSLAVVIDTYRKIGWWAVRELSHDDAWDEAWKARSWMRKSVAMTAEGIAKHLDDAALVAHIQDPFPGEARPPAGLDLERFRSSDSRAA